MAVWVEVEGRAENPGKAFGRKWQAVSVLAPSSREMNSKGQASGTIRRPRQTAWLGWVIVATMRDSSVWVLNFRRHWGKTISNLNKLKTFKKCYKEMFNNIKRNLKLHNSMDRNNIYLKSYRIYLSFPTILILTMHASKCVPASVCLWVFGPDCLLCKQRRA